jgi:homoserine kinase type II
MKLTILDCREIFQHYDFGTVRAAVRFAGGYTDANFKVTTSTGNYLLRISQEKRLEDMEYEVRLLEKLKSERLPAAFPLKDKRQNYIHPTKHGNAIVYEFVDGVEPELNAGTVSEIACAVARLNSLPDWQKYQRKNPIGFDFCRSLIPRFALAKNQFPEVFRYFGEETTLLSEPLSVKLPEGLIHGDVFTDNTLFRGNKLLAIIDFEEACTGRLLVDVGMTINGFCFLKNRLDEALFEVFLKAYDRCRTLSKEEKALLPWYVELGAHAMLSWHLSYLLEDMEAQKYNRMLELKDRVVALRKSRSKIERLVQMVL